ncbi:MAG: hypothetical protein LAT53_10160 [Idiomarina sp.]|nr:hypothetical protein [Idiomarina sp.]
MRKTHQKIDKQIIKALTAVCEDAKYECEGFTWLTHEVDYQRFPQSLRVVLVFTQDTPEQALLTGLQSLVPVVQAALAPIINHALPAKQIEARYEHTVQ